MSASTQINQMQHAKKKEINQIKEDHSIARYSSVILTELIICHTGVERFQRFCGKEFH